MVRESAQAGGGWRPYRERVFSYDNRWSMLQHQQVSQVTTTRFDPARPQATMPMTEYSLWDAPAAGAVPRLQLLRSYRSDPSGEEVGTQFGYDSGGRLQVRAPYRKFKGVEEPPPNRLSIVYDDAVTGQPVSWTTTYRDDPAGGMGALARTQTEFDSGFRPCRSSDERGVSTVMAWDLFGRPTVTARDGEAPITMAYPDAWSKMTTQSGNMTRETFDAFGRRIRTELPDGRVIEQDYDRYGREAEWRETGAGGVRRRSIRYDPLDRVTSSTTFDGVTTTYDYSTDGLSDVTRQTIQGQGLQTTISRNVFGQVTQVVAPNGDRTVHIFDGFGNRRAVTRFPARGGTPQNRTFLYDQLDRLIFKIEPEAWGQAFKDFDAMGKAATFLEDAGGKAERKTVREFDGLGRLRARTSGTMTEQFTYQGPFLIRSTCGPREGAAIVQTFAYGGPGARLSEETSAQDGFTARVGYGYDDRGRLESLTYPSGRTVHYGYDDLNRLASVAQNGSPVATVPPGVGYDPWQNLQTLVFGSGSQDQWLRDASGVRLAQWNLLTADPEVAQVRKYAYDPAGRLVQAGEWTQLGYDLNDRLVSAEGYGVQQSLAYDAYDNNVSSVVAGDVPAGRVNFTFLPQVDNRFPNKTATGGLVDGAQNVHGEMLRLPDGVGAGPALTLGWDGLGRLVEAGPGDGNSKVSYQYSAAGRRVVRRDHGDPGRDRGYVYASNGLLLSEFAPAPGTSSLQWQRDVVYLDRQAIAEVDGQGVHELHSDHLGSPRVITAGADGMAVAKGHTEGTQTFGPYGERWAGSQTGYLPLTGYTGHLQAEPNHLIYMKGRFYSPTWHRFLSSDQGVDEKSLNQFAYVRGNPMMATDPTGLVDGGMNSRDAAQHETAHHATLEAERAIERGERNEALERFEREQELMEHWTGLSYEDVVSRKAAQLYEQRNNDIKARMEKKAVQNYLSKILNSTKAWAMSGVATGLLGGVIVGPGEFVIGPGMALAGGALGGVSGMAYSAIFDGISLRSKFRQIEKDWNDNLININNWYRMGSVGVPGSPQFSCID
jgi:RHS repeat-associated protein